ncbi:MAG: HAMP domain-containing sensor histidine kinase [Ignavibacteriaceae bacterium]
MPLTDDNIQDNKLHLVGKLTASLIHEIRNPLSVIKLNLDYLKMIDSELPAEAIESIDMCKDAFDRIQQLIDNMLTFTKRNSKSQTYCSINEITHSALGIMRYNAERKNVQLNVNLDEDLPQSFFDKSKLLQVFLNLITNALESCDTNGKVNIRTYRENYHVIVWEVVDTGVGISDEDKTKIFEDFFTSKEKGTGLGLSVCRMILQEYDAELNFESKLGEGSRFFIKFNPILKQGNNEPQDINY